MPGTDLLARADALRCGRTPFVLATVVRAERPTSARAGDRALILADGTIEGFVGGACAESTVRLQGLRLLRSGDSTLLRITPAAGGSEQAVAGLVTVGNPCLSGGTLEIFLEAVLPAPLLHVFGTAPVARALSSLGAALGYAVRASQDPAEAIAPDTSAVVVASHGRDEEPVLAAALRAGVPYVGLVASRRRGSTVLAGLDVDDEALARVRTPAGLDIGARTAPEIALSVLAELVASRPRPAGPAPRGRVLAGPAEATGETGRAGATGATGATGGTGVVEAVEATDPVCQMAVAASAASVHLEFAGRTWYFCGSGCRQAFADDPTRYAGQGV